jgi:hypothetical protein
LSTQATSDGAWNVAILCATIALGEDAQRQLEETLSALDLLVRCHVRRWRFEELGDSTVFEVAVDRALEADLVILAGGTIGVIPEELRGVLAEWLFRCGAEASPLAIAPNSGVPGEEGRGEFDAALRRLTDPACVPIYTTFTDAVVGAWDLWEWKHFAWRQAEAEAPVRGRSDSLAHGQRRAAQPDRPVFTGGAGAGTGGTSRHAFTMSRR